MRLATIKLHGAEVAGIVTGKGILPVAAPHSGGSYPRPDDVLQ